MSQEISFGFNGNKINMVVEDHWTLLYLIREELGYTGTKEGLRERGMRCLYRYCRWRCCQLLSVSGCRRRW